MEESKDRNAPSLTATEKTIRSKRNRTDHPKADRESVKDLPDTLIVPLKPERDGTHPMIPKMAAGEKAAQGMGFFKHTGPELDGGPCVRQTIRRIRQHPANTAQQWPVFINLT
jgi:hypothetical protein